MVVHQRLRLEPPPGGRLPSTRPGSEVVLRFTSPLDPASARTAVRVEDPTRGAIPVDVEVRGSDLVLRPRAGETWRPGGTLRVRIAGLPALTALRSTAGAPLDRDAEVEVIVRSPRRMDRTAPLFIDSDPRDGAIATDPAAPLVLRFSEPMDARALSLEARGSPWDPIRVEAAGRVLPYTSFLDRSRTLLTLLPVGGLPPRTEVFVELGSRVRDAEGNPLEVGTTARFSFTTGPAGPGGLVVEAFEDDRRLDPLGTTVRWNHSAEPGVLSGVLESRVLEVGVEGEERAFLLDPRGGVLTVLLSAADLGDEPRTLKGLHLVALPGAAGGEILEPRVRITPAGGFRPGDGLDPAAWQEAASGPSGTLVRGGVFPLPFRHPVRHDGISDLMVEFSWSGTAGTVILRATRTADFRASMVGPGPEASVLQLSPVLRIDALGERPVARSLWIDSGADAPSWLAPAPLPSDGGAVLRLQGAPTGEDGGPDVARATDWTGDPAELEGMQWVRFRVIFDPASAGETPAALDRLDLPFVSK